MPIIYFVGPPNQVRIFVYYSYMWVGSKLILGNLGGVVLLALFTCIIVQLGAIYRKHCSSRHYSLKALSLEILTLFLVFLLFIPTLFIICTGVRFFSISKFLHMKEEAHVRCLI
jgi:hypothetical protein